MTIEIRQLVIRAVVDEGARTAAAAVTPGRHAADDEPAGAAAALPEDRQALVAVCVREVLRQLERERAR